jgi:hypothetical protein
VKRECSCGGCFGLHSPILVLLLTSSELASAAFGNNLQPITTLSTTNLRGPIALSILLFCTPNCSSLCSHEILHTPSKTCGGQPTRIGSHVCGGS